MDVRGPLWGWAGAQAMGVALALALFGAGPSPGWALCLAGLGAAMALPGVHRQGLARWLLLVALVAAGGARAAASLPTRTAPPLAGRVVSAWRGSATVELHGPSTRVRLGAPEGTVRPGDLAWLTEEQSRRRPASPPPGVEGRGAAGATPAPLVAQADTVRRLRGGGGGPARSPLGDLRRRGLGACAAHGDETTAGLLAALLLGDTHRLPPGVADLFTRTGTRHLLALSGLHVALLAALVGLPLARLLAAIASGGLAACGARRRVGPALPLALLAALFVPLSGSGAPASRAALALACAALAPRLAEPRRPSGPDLLGLALTVELLIDPLAPCRPGVLLSYLATAALLLVAPRGAPRVAAALPGLGLPGEIRRSGRRRQPLLRSVHLFAARALGLGVGASCVATLATLPVVWTVFGEVAWAGALLTPLALPFVTVLIVGGWLWVAIPWLVPEALLTGVAHGLIELLAASDALAGTPAVLPERPIVLVASACALGLRSLQSGSVPLGRAACVGFAALLAPLPVGGAGPPASLEVHVLDVGDGTSVLVRAPGASPLLVDAGSRDRYGVARHAVAPLMRALDEGRLDVALTHDHADHARDLPWIARRFGVVHWLGPHPERGGTGGPGPAPWGGAPHLHLERGARRVPGDALGVRLVRGGPFPGNEGSLVLELEWTDPGSGARRRVVLTGDAEDHGLAAMLPGTGARGLTPAGGSLEAGPVDALLLPHHGSASPHLGRLLDHLRPAEVWISASNPPEGAARECSRRGLPLWVTGRDGAWSWSPETWEPHGPMD